MVHVGRNAGCTTHRGGPISDFMSPKSSRTSCPRDCFTTIFFVGSALRSRERRTRDEYTRNTHDLRPARKRALLPFDCYKCSVYMYTYKSKDSESPPIWLKSTKCYAVSKECVNEFCIYESVVMYIPIIFITDLLFLFLFSYFPIVNKF